LGKVEFGLRIPSFPVDGSTGQAFTDQIINFISRVEGDFSSA